MLRDFFIAAFRVAGAVLDVLFVAVVMLAIGVLAVMAGANPAVFVPLAFIIGLHIIGKTYQLFS